MKSAIDRLPPYDEQCERALLGCILIDPSETMSLCMERNITTADFYDVRCQTVYEMFCGMYEQNEPIDYVTLHSKLASSNAMADAGGVEFVNLLPDASPSAVNASFYLDTLADKTSLRRLIASCTKLVSDAYDRQYDVDDLLDFAETEILKLRRQDMKDACQHAKKLVPLALSHIQAIYERQGSIGGIETGFIDLDKMTDGLHPAEMFVIAARPSMGKAQPLDCKVLTPCGFKNIGNLCIGDEVVGRTGTSCTVEGVFDKGELEVYEVGFTDGTKTRCCLDHLWFTQTRNERRSGRPGSVKSLGEIANTITRNDSSSPNHVVPNMLPVVFDMDHGPLPLSPWLIGALLGDGHLAAGNICFSKPEKDVQQKLKSLLPESDCAVDATGDCATLRIKRKERINEPSETKKAITSMGLSVFSESKFIPKRYLYASPSDRLSLLQGILDTDGFTISNGTIEFSTSSRAFAVDVSFLARSLGAICSEADPRIPSFSYKGVKKDGLTSYRMNIWFDGNALPLTTSLKHQAKQKKFRSVHKSILSVDRIGNQKCRCIKVSAADGLYVTDDFIVTHNTSLAMNIAEHVAVRSKLPVGVFSLEMKSDALMGRILCSRANINLKGLQEGFLSEGDFARIRAQSVILAAAPLYIDDTGGLSIMQIKARARRMKQQYGIRLFVLDYLQLAHSTSARAQENRQTEVADISSGLKALAKELDVPFIVLSQLNRDVEREKGRKPRMSDLRESGAIEQDADIIGLLYKAETKDEECENSEAEAINLYIAKQRNGPVDDVNLVFLRPFTRFESAARVSNDESNDSQPRYRK